MQAVVLAGGKGTRLASVLQGKPKPLVDVGGKPLLERQIGLLLEHGIKDIILLVNYQSDQIEQFIASKNGYGANISIIDDGEPRGTAGAVLEIVEKLADQFLVVYGDTMINVDLSRFIAAHQQDKFDATLFVHPNDHPQDSDIVELDDAGLITAFHSYPHPVDEWLPNLVNAALYVVNKSALAAFVSRSPPLDFAKDLFPAMLAAGARLGGYISFEYIKDLGTPKRLAKVEGHLATGLIERASLERKQRAVFLDRDGTVNIQKGYIRDLDSFELVPGAGEAIKLLNDLEYRVVVATNQPVIARGELSVPDLRKLHAKMDTLLARSGAYLDAVFFCPHHPDGGFPGEVPELKFACDCRKPNIGLVRQAVDRLNIDVAQSWFIGDSTSDMMAARKANLRSILVLTGEGGRDGKYDVAPDFVASDIAGAVRIVAEQPSRLP
jgi:D,D-heptose 1,7-bisphosphate phosphatase